MPVHRALEVINLNNVLVTDRSLPLLARLKSLRQLEINYCSGITEAGIAGFKKDLPDVEVVR